MTGLLKRKHKAVEPVETEATETSETTEATAATAAIETSAAAETTATTDLFDRMLEGLIRVEERREDGTRVVRAELPGIDPDKDVELTVSDGMLHIAAEHLEDEQTKDEGYLRRELHYASFSRSLPLPDGVTEADVTASYQDGILEIRVPAPEAKPATKIPVTRP